MAVKWVGERLNDKNGGGGRAPSAGEPGRRRPRAKTKSDSGDATPTRD